MIFLRCVDVFRSKVWIFLGSAAVFLTDVLIFLGRADDFPSKVMIFLRCADDFEHMGYGSLAALPLLHGGGTTALEELQGSLRTAPKRPKKIRPGAAPN